MDIEPEKWIYIIKWLPHGSDKDHLRATSLWVRREHILYFRKTQKNIYAHFDPKIFGTEKGSPNYGIVHDESGEQLHIPQEIENNELMSSMNALSQRLEYNPIIGTAMHNFEDANVKLKNQNTKYE